MAHLTLILKSIGVILNSITSKIDLLFTDVDEYLKGESCGNNKHIHGKNHSNINHITYQGVLYQMSYNQHIYGKKTHNVLLIDSKEITITT